MRSRSNISIDRSGFTMVELFATVLVIALLAGLILGVAGAANKKAANAKAKSDLQMIAGKIEEWKAVHGFYPYQATAKDLSTVTANAGAQLNTLERFYSSDLNESIKELTMDPWGKGYYYQTESPRQYTLWSYGPDALTGSGDSNSDGQQDNIDDVTL